MFRSMTLVDETSSENMTLQLFLSPSSKVPALLQAGDLIRAHRVSLEVKYFRNDDVLIQKG